MNGLVLPHSSNRLLIKLLTRLFIESDYAKMVNNLSLYLRCPKIKGISETRDLLLLIDKILLGNIYRYAETGESAPFFKAMSNNMFGYEFGLSRVVTSEFFKPMMSYYINPGDVFGIENLINNEIISYISQKYNEEPAAFNEAFLDIFQMYQTNVPMSRINVVRFELTPNMSPLLLYTDR